MASSIPASAGLEYWHAVPPYDRWLETLDIPIYTRERLRLIEERRRQSTWSPRTTQSERRRGSARKASSRVPIDDTHTYHINYQVYQAPAGIEAPAQDVIPSFEVPINDDNGNPILDYVLAQDMVAWYSQGELTDRSKEKLGTTDAGIIMFRRRFDQGYDQDDADRYGPAIDLVKEMMRRFNESRAVGVSSGS